jgi:elongation factor G
MPLPRPILSLTIAPVDPGEGEHLRAVLAAVCAADPAISFRLHAGSSLTRLHGESVEQLMAVYRRIEHESLIPLHFARPEILRIETLRQSAEGEGKYICQTGGKGNYGHVKLRLDPAPPGSGIAFASTAGPEIIPTEFLAPIEEGVRESARAGVVAGCEFVDLCATLFDGSYHEADSNPMAFRIAASHAFQDAARQGHPVVMEPAMNVVFTIPESRLGATLTEISARRGRVVSTDNLRGVVIVQALAPLAEMLRDMDPAPTVMLFERFEPIARGGDDADSSGSAVQIPRRPFRPSDAAAADPDLDWT